MSKSDDSGLMSSAGLVRYFDEDTTSVTIDPRTLLAVAVFVGLFIHILTAAL